MAWAAAAIGVVALLLIAFSGGGESEEDRVRERADAFWTAVVTGDGATACELATPGAQLELGGWATDFRRPAAPADCPDGAEILGRGGSASAVHDYDHGEVTVDGDAAAVAADPIPFCLRMLRSGDEWLADSVPSPYQPGGPDCAP